MDAAATAERAAPVRGAVGSGAALGRAMGVREQYRGVQMGELGEMGKKMIHKLIVNYFAWLDLLTV